MLVSCHVTEQYPVPLENIITGELPEEKDPASHMQHSLLAVEVFWESTVGNLHQPETTQLLHCQHVDSDKSFSTTFSHLSAYTVDPAVEIKHSHTHVSNLGCKFPCARH